MNPTAIGRWAVLLCLLCTSASLAAEPRWEPYIVARGARREQIKQMNILHRPNRPLHFYGNTVRRMHYRGRFLPAPRDFGRGITVFLFRR